MIMQTTNLPGVRIIIPQRFSDERGFFYEVFNKSTFEAAGISFCPVQENQSLSRSPGTVRGLHFQNRPHAQGKLVRVIRGRVFDVAVDIREGSPTFGRWVGAELTADRGEQMLIPEGFAHGFCTLEPDCEIAYLVNAHYSAECDHAIFWNDPEIGINWPDIAGTVVSDKDRSAPKLSEVPTPFPDDALGSGA